MGLQAHLQQSQRARPEELMTVILHHSGNQTSVTAIHDLCTADKLLVTLGLDLDSRGEVSCLPSRQCRGS